MMSKNWRNLEVQIGAGLAGKTLFLDIIPFRWAKPALRKPHHPFMGDKKTRIQAWFGPFHYWSYLHDYPLTVSLEVNFHGGFHGSPPSGYNPVTKLLVDTVNRIRDSG